MISANYCKWQDQYDECKDMDDMCDEDEESMSEEFQVKNICKETCDCIKNKNYYEY